MIEARQISYFSTVVLTARFNMKMPVGRRFCGEVSAFPKGAHDDDVDDVTSGRLVLATVIGGWIIGQKALVYLIRRESKSRDGRSTASLHQQKRPSTDDDRRSKADSIERFNDSRLV
jgi:hypothetical protein